MLGDRGRYAMLTAALVAGVGVAGASATDATPSQAHSAAQTGLAPSPSAVAPSAPSTPAPALSTPAPALSTRALPSSGPTDASVAGSPGDADSVVITPPATGTGLSWIAPKRKAKPAPVTAPWVNPLPEAAVTSCFGQRWGR
ncbi:MAG: hypothetical protein ACJ786_19035, partial [Catenulispora sp.]